MVGAELSNVKLCKMDVQRLGVEVGALERTIDLLLNGTRDSSDDISESIRTVCQIYILLVRIWNLRISCDLLQYLHKFHFFSISFD